MEFIKIDKDLLGGLFEKAVGSERKRMNYDMRTSSADNSQRMLNALIPGTDVAIHRHPNSSENVICLCGRMDEVLYEEVKEFIRGSELDRGMDAQDTMARKVLREVERIHLCPAKGAYGCVVPAGVWHSVEVIEPSVIYEAKDGKYGEDGSETFPVSSDTSFQNSLGDLRKNIEYLIGNERQLGNMEVLTSSYISRILHVPIDKVEKTMKEMGL